MRVSSRLVRRVALASAFTAMFTGSPAVVRAPLAWQPVAYDSRCLADGTMPPRLVSAVSSGNGANGTSFNPAISRDGNTVVYGTAATNLTGANGLVATDLTTGAHELVSVDSDEVASTGRFATLSDDGKVVGFDSTSATLGTDRNASALFGSGDKVTIADNAAFDFTGNMTVEAWIYPTGSGAYQWIASKSSANGASNNTFELRLDPNLRLQFLQYAGTSLQTVTYTVPVTLNTWSHVAAVRNGSTATLYINGDNMTGGPISGTTSINARPVYIGARDDVARFYGRIDEVAVFSTALSEARLLAHYQGGAGYRAAVRNDSPRGYWRLGETSGTTANDTSGGGRTGTYSGVTLKQPGALATATTTYLDAFVRDRVAGTTTLVSLHSNGEVGNAASAMPSVSKDGRYVAFSSGATNLVTGDTNAQPDIFVRDRTLNTTTRVSVGPADAQANGWSDYAQISGDGRYVVFSSAASNLTVGDTNGVADIYVRDRTSGTTTRVSVAAGGIQANGESYYPQIARAGNVVAFRSAASNLTSGDTNGVADVYVVSVTGTGVTNESWVAGAPVAPWGSTGGWYPSISADGRYVAYESSGTPSQSGGINQGELIRDRTTGTVSVLSTSSEVFSAPTRLTSLGRPMSNLSGDGRRLAVYSSTGFDRDDVNGIDDVYVFDRGPVTKTEITRFKQLWGRNRADNQTFVDSWTADRTVPATITAEGFHGLPEESKRFLADCLLAQFEVEDPRDAGYTQQHHDELSRMLYDFIFAKTAYIDYVPGNDTYGGATTLPTGADSLVPAGMREALAAVAFEAAPAPDAAVLPGVTSASRPLAATIVGEDPSIGLSHDLPTAAGDLAQSLDLGNTDVSAAAQAAADAAEAEVNLAKPLDDVHEFVLPVPLVDTAYAACWRSATNADEAEPTCVPATVGTPVALDVNRDLVDDVTAEFVPAGSPATTAPVSGASAGATFELVRLPGAPADLKAHVWIVYDLPLVARRVSVGFDGFTRGGSIGASSSVSYTLDDLLAVLQGDLKSNYAIHHVDPGTAVALTATVAKLDPATNETSDPIDASVLMAPVPLRLSGRIDSVKSDTSLPSGTDTVRTTRRDVLVTATPTEPTVLSPVVSHRVTHDSPSGPRVEQRRLSAVVDRLAGELRVEIDSTDVDSTDDAADRETVEAEVTALPGFAPDDVRIGLWTVPDAATPGTESRIAVRVLDMPDRVKLTSVARQDVREASIDASSTTGSATVSAADYVEGAFAASRTATVVGVPEAAKVTYTRTGDSAVKVDYAASAPTTEVRVAARDADGPTALNGKVLDVPATWQVRADSATKSMHYAGDAPIGLIDVTYGTNGVRPYRPAGEHATLVRRDSGLALGFRLAQLKSADLTHDGATNAVVRLGSGGRPFLLAYRDPSNYAYLDASALPATVDVTVDPALGKFDYLASAGIPRLHGYFTKRGTGPTVDAVVTGVPGEMHLTARKGEVSGFEYQGSAGISGVAAAYSPASVEKVTDTTEHVGMTAHGLPAHWRVDVDTTRKFATWAADTAIPDVTVSARGMGDDNLSLLGAVRGVPTAFRIDFPKGKVALSQLSSPIDTVLVAVSNHGDVHTQRGAHAAFHQSEAAGSFDGSVLGRNVSSASFEQTATGFTVTGGFDYGTEPLKVDLRRDARIAGGSGDEERLAVRGSVSNVPSGFTVTKAGETVTYTAPGKPGVFLTAEYGWIAALEADSAAPPIRYGLSVRDVACDADDCRPASDGPFCDAQAGTCGAIIGIVNLNGLPNEVILDLAEGIYTLKGYDPAAGDSTVRARADIRHVLGSTKLLVEASQAGVSGPLDMTFGPFGGGGGAGQASKLRARAEFSKPLGAFHVAANLTGASGVEDAQVTLHVTNVPQRLDVTAGLGEQFSLDVANSQAIDSIVVTGYGVYGDTPARARAALGDIPATVNITASTGKSDSSEEAQGMRFPHLTYSAAAAGLDGSVQVDSGFVTKTGPARVAVPHVEFSFTDLGTTASATIKYKTDGEGKQTKDVEYVEVRSMPAAKRLQFGADVNAVIPKEDFTGGWSFEVGQAKFELKGHAGGRLRVKDAQLALTDFEGVRMAPGKRYLAWGWAKVQGLAQGALEVKTNEVELEVDIYGKAEFKPGLDKKFVRSTFREEMHLFDADKNDQDEQTPYRDVVFHAAVNAEGSFEYFKRPYYGDPEADTECLPIDAQPQPVIGRNSANVPVSNRNRLQLPPPHWNPADGTDFVFTFLDPGGAMPDVIIELFVSGYLSPWDTDLHPAVNETCPPEGPEAS